MKKILILFLLLASFATAQEIPSPVSGSYVHDFAGVMTPEQRTALHDRLIQLKKKYTVETAIVIVETVGDRGIDDYALRLGREWGVGGKSNNGLVILTAINDRKWRIEIGYGLEGDLTDASSSNLAREYLAPRFKEKNYYQGFMDLIDQIDKAIDPAAAELKRQEMKKLEEKWKEQEAAVVEFLMWLLGIAISIGMAVVLWKWRERVLTERKRALDEAKSILRSKRKVLEDIPSAVIRIENLGPDKEERARVESIVEKYRGILSESTSDLTDIKEVQKRIATIDSFDKIGRDRAELLEIEQTLKEFRDLKTTKLSYSDVGTEKGSIDRSFTNSLFPYDPDFGAESKRIEESQAAYFQELDEHKKKFEELLLDKKNLKKARQTYNLYYSELNKARNLNDELRSRVFKAEEKKRYVDGFDKSVEMSLMVFLGIAAMSYISRETREDAEKKVAALREESKKLDRSPEGISALQKFMDGIGKGFTKLMSEKEEFDKKERIKKEEERKRQEEEDRKRREAERKKREEEDRKRRKKEEEEEEERRRRNSYSSSSSSWDYGSSSSSSSSSSDSYSGGSFGGGGSSGDW